MTKTHWLIFRRIYLVFTIIIGVLVGFGADKTDYVGRVVLTTLGSITGPMIGAISRNFQSCCLEFSLRVLLIASPILILGLGVQFIKTDNPSIATLKLWIWSLAWISWFSLGIATFGHALA